MKDMIIDQADKETKETHLTPELAFIQYQQNSEGKSCQVCNQPAAGFHHRAYVCEACKKFFMRHATPKANKANEPAGPPGRETKLAFTSCSLGGKCRIIGPGRGKCASCRFRKCLDIGMCLIPSKTSSNCKISNIPCRICGGSSSGFHFGAITCEGCKGFFRRTSMSNVKLECSGSGNCSITPSSRNICKSCRMKKCIEIGMSREGCRIGRQPNAVKYFCAKEISILKSTDANKNATARPADTSKQTSLFSDSYSPIDSFENAPTNEEEEMFTDQAYENANASPNSSTNDMSVFANAVAFAAKATLALMDEDKNKTGATKGEQSIVHEQFKLQHSNSHISSNNIDPASLDAFQSNLFSNNSAPTSSSKAATSKSVIKSFKMAPKEGVGSSTLDYNESPIAKTMRKTFKPTSEVDYNTPRTVDNDVDSILNDKTASNFFINEMEDENTSDNYRVDLSRNSSSSHLTDYPSYRMQNSNESFMETITSGSFEMNANEEEPFPDYDKTNYESLRTKIVPEIGMFTIQQFHSAIVEATLFKREERQAVMNNLLCKSQATLKIGDPISVVWDRMIHHFEIHTRFIINFLKKIPGFNFLQLDDKRHLVRGAMYPVMLIELSKDFDQSVFTPNDYNYFDFSPEERDIILEKFPSFTKFPMHLIQSGSLIQALQLSDVELTYLCALEVFGTSQKPNYLKNSDACQYLYSISLHSFQLCVKNMGYQPKQRFSSIKKLSIILERFNCEHHDIVAELCRDHPDLTFPELYVDMFNITLEDQRGMIYGINNPNKDEQNSTGSVKPYDNQKKS